MSKKNINNHESDREYIDFTYIFKKFSVFNRDNIFSTFIIIMFSLALGVLYILFKTPVYKTYTSVEINIANRDNIRQTDDLLRNINQDEINDIETEIDIIKSKFVISKAIKATGYGVRYFKSGFLSKKIEFYNNSPFRADDIKIKNPLFLDRYIEIEPIDKNSFELNIKNSLISKLKKILGIKNKKIDFTKYNGIYRYGENINNPDFLCFRILFKGRACGNKNSVH